MRGLSKNFGGLKAVDDVSFQVRQGMILGIIGPNGAGKTTAFNLLNGFIAPSAGDVLLDGRSILGLQPHQVCELGVGRTFQIMRPFMRMSVADNVVVGAYVRAATDAEARRLADEAIERVGLSAVAQRVASELTSKELRLMELARALAGQPRLLLLDETLAGLGQAEAEEVLAVLRGLAAEDKTIVIIEHTMHLMVRLVDRFLVLDHGRVLAEGGPDEIIKNSERDRGLSRQKVEREECLRSTRSPAATAARRCCAMSRSRSAKASSWPWSVPTAPASRRCSRPSPACSRRAPARSASRAPTSATSPPRAGRISASPTSPRAARCSRRSP